MQLTRLLGLSLLAASLVGCGDDDDDGTGPGDTTAQLRIVNAAPGSANVQVFRSGSTAPIATLNFRDATQSCVEVPAGSAQTFTFRSGTTTLATVDATIPGNQRWSLFLVSTSTSTRAVALSDAHVAEASNNALRFINATSASGDVYVTTPTGNPSPSTRAIGGFGPLAMSNEQPAYLSRPATDTRVRLYNTGVTTGNPRADITLTGLPTSRLATVVFTDPGTPAGSTAFLVFPCP